MASFSSSAFDTTAFSENAFSIGATTAVDIDTNDGEDQRKKYKQSQQRRRSQIESAVNAIFADPIALEEAKPILKAFSVTKSEKPIEKKDIDLERFALNQENLDWLNGILKAREDEEQMLISYLISRH